MSELKVDTISERTAANGVAVDGVTIKDSGLTIPSGGTLDIASGATIDATGATITGFPQGGLQHITTVTNTSAASSIDVAGCFTSTYKKYRVVMNKVSPVTNTTHVYLNFGNSDLSTIEDAYQWALSMYAAGFSAENQYSENVASGSSGIRLATDMANSTNYGVCMSIDIYQPYASDVMTAFAGHGWAFNNSGNYANTYMIIGNTMASDSAVRSESLRITAQTGNMAGHAETSVSVYGYAES